LRGALHQRDGQARRAGAAGAADAVHVVLGVEGHVEVEDRRQVGDVQAARGHVGGHQQVDFAALEGGQRLQALVLALVAVQRLGRRPSRSKERASRAAPSLELTKTMACDSSRSLEQDLAHDGALVVVGHAVEALLDIGGRGVGARHFDQHRVCR
jgi:hypothetical protein